jgi:hypothetical protein
LDVRRSGAERWTLHPEFLLLCGVAFSSDTFASGAIPIFSPKSGLPLILQGRRSSLIQYRQGWRHAEYCVFVRICNGIVIENQFVISGTASRM